MHNETLERQIRRRLQPALPVRQAPDHLFVSLLGEARGLMHGHDEHRILLVSESRRPILTTGWRTPAPIGNHALAPRRSLGLWITFEPGGPPASRVHAAASRT